MSRSRLAALACVLVLAPSVQATVFLNEVFINPPQASDNGREFIELFGTPGMKLDGYAIAVLSGTREKLYTLGGIPPIPQPHPEIDEFFSLDGLSLGQNGILVIGIQSGISFWYPTLLSDSNFTRWLALWNGDLDIPGLLDNNGSVTVMLVRNRPGQTEADPTNPAGLRWGKDIAHDTELVTPVLDLEDVCLGETATFTVGATASGAPTYQWQKDGLDLVDGGDISGVTTDALQISNVELADEGFYGCIVTSPCGGRPSSLVALTTGIGVKITQPPLPQDLCTGDTATFAVTATGPGILTYQWQQNGLDMVDGGNISGATTATLQITGVGAINEVDYRCVVTGDCGSRPSREVPLTLNVGVTITQPSSPQDVCPGETATFTVAATGSGTLTHQWQKDGVDLVDGGDVSGATTQTLQVANAEPADEGYYHCVVTSVCGHLTSFDAPLTVGIGVTISPHPARLDLCPGEVAPFTIGAAGSGGFTYQWQKDLADLVDGGDVSGATTDSLQIANVDGADEGDYRCVVTGACGSRASGDAALTVGIGVTITQPPAPPDGPWRDQWGDGSLDRGQPDGWWGGDTLDLLGAGTPGDVTDDLEVVDEVSYEDGRGWEYDVDGRRVDLGSSSAALSRRGVHGIDDPAGFNPDALSRVDYRTKGDGWLPSGGGTGELPNGNNWQDTATEQWIRGESVAAGVPGEGRIGFFFMNDANTDPDAVQPYNTHVPLWLDDGVAPDYDFISTSNYEIAAGRINPLAVPFIPGDSDRDGDCDADDIAEIATVFGDDDWFFSNAYAEAPEGDSGDPAAQTRPWNVDATGDNGIEPSDLQWTLNFQGDTTGQIVGVQYDSPTPAASGVILNPNAGVECTMGTWVNIPSGRTLTTLHVGDVVEIMVVAQVTAGANTISGEENGIMQYAHDVAISSPGVIKVASITPLCTYVITRPSLQSLQGADGDLGVNLVHAYTTDFDVGNTTLGTLYLLTLEAIGGGSADLTILPSAAANFAGSTPTGLKVGHTDANGEPSFVLYPAPLSIGTLIPGDIDGDGDVDSDDLDAFVAVLLDIPFNPEHVSRSDMDGDGVADGDDIPTFVVVLMSP